MLHKEIWKTVFEDINPLQGKNRHGGAINTAAFPFGLRCRAFLDASRAHACANMLYDIAIACLVSHGWMFLQETCILLTFEQVLHWGVVTKWLRDIYKPKTNDAWEALETEQKCQNWGRLNLVPGNTESWVSDCKKQTLSGVALKKGFPVTMWFLLPVLHL